MSSSHGAADNAVQELKIFKFVDPFKQVQTQTISLPISAFFFISSPTNPDQDPSDFIAP